MTATNEIPERVASALGEPEPSLAVHALVTSLLSEGYSRRQLSGELENFRTERQPDEDADDAIVDVIAVLDGWASDTAVRRLLPPPCVAPRASSLK